MSGPRLDDQRPSADLSPDEVAAWLQDHPDFIGAHTELLLRVETPSRFGADRDAKVLDLQQRMIQRLKAETERQARVGRALLEAGTNNLDAQARCHQAILTLLEARGFDDFLARLRGPAAEHLGVIAVAIGVEAPEGRRPPAPLTTVAALHPGSVDRLIGRDRKVRLRSHFDRGQAKAPGPFGARAREVKSDALVRLSLGRAAAPALLALGAASPSSFEADQGTDLLLFLAGVVERMIVQWLDLPPA